MKLRWVIPVLFLLLFQFQGPAQQNYEIDTRISHLGEFSKVTQPWLNQSYSYFRLELSVEVYNWANFSQDTGTVIYSKSCSIFPTIEISNDTYEQAYEQFYKNTCTVAPQEFEPGITVLHNIEIIFGFKADLDKVPNGKYTIYAKTYKGTSYKGYITVSNDDISKSYDGYPSNWLDKTVTIIESSRSDVINENETGYETDFQTSSFVISFIFVAAIFNFRRKKKN